MDKRKNHIVFWSSYFFYYTIIVIFAWGNMLSLHELLIKIIVAFGVTFISFYFFAYFLLPQTIPSKRYFILILGIVLSLSFVPIFCYSFLVLFSSDDVTELTFNGYSNLLFKNILSFFRAVNFALLFWFLKVFIEKLKEKQEIELKSSVLKQAVLSSELLGLKNQISPHFFYNCLNFLYSQSLPYSAKFSKTILTLSEMMRYAIREKEDEHTILLEQEIDYVKKYIYLEDCCSINEYKVVLEIIGNTKYRCITPMMLRTILDNSFKYGKKQYFQLIVRKEQIQFTSIYTKKETVDINEIYANCGIIRNKLADGSDLLIQYDSLNQLCKIHLYLVS